MAVVQKRIKRGKYELHGLSSSRAYAAWKNMKARCKGYQSKQNRDYRLRGITYCTRWFSFKAFLADMGHPPEGLTLDRVNNDGPYSKRNCRWATRSQQQLNQRPLIRSNRSGVKGVCWSTRDKVWIAFYRGKHLAKTKNFNLAVLARQKAEKQERKS